MKKFAALVVLVLASATLADSSFINSRSHDNEELSCDLPGSQHMRNTVGTDGSGLCVFTSIEMAARWCGMEDFRGFRDFVGRGPGGGYPQKVDEMIKRWCQLKKIPIPPYVQYEGSDPAIILDLCDRTGRMACMTYGYSPRYGNGFIAHMTCCPKYDGKYAVCLDNNFPGEDKYEWMSKAELVRRIRLEGSNQIGNGWVFVWLAPPPPPIPSN